MRNSSDPTVHREREKQLIDHVERLLGDDRLRIDTMAGRRPATSMRRDIRTQDRSEDLKRLMIDLGVFDRELESRMPVGRELSVTLSRTFFWVFRTPMARLKVVCLPPWRALIEGAAPVPLSLHDVRAMLASSPGTEAAGGVPLTLVVLSTSGFTQDARELAERRSDRTVILVEPNDAGGWNVIGPQETKAIVDLFDPELDAEKRQRVHEQIQAHMADLLSGGLSAGRIAAATKLPLQLVEEELKSYAKQAAGFVARRVEGNVLLFREGTVAAEGAGGSQMPIMQRLKDFFGGKGDNEKKIALLSERRAALSLKRDQAYEEMGVLEGKELELREQFKQTTNSITRRRVTSQLVQLRKDLERRQQLLAVLNQQINVNATHLHNLELVQQGQDTAAPSPEELAEDAAAAEQVLADLQASTELAGSISAVGPSGMSEEEQALYEELEKEASAAPSAPQQATTPPAAERPQRAAPQREAISPPPVPPRRERARGEAEPG